MHVGIRGALETGHRVEPGAVVAGCGGDDPHKLRIDLQRLGLRLRQLARWIVEERVGRIRNKTRKKRLLFVDRAGQFDPQRAHALFCAVVGEVPFVGRQCDAS